MINLLPPEIKSDLIYARRNTKLLHWVMTLVLVIAGFGIIIVFGNLYINRSKTLYAEQVNMSQQQLKVQNLEGTKQQVDEFSNQMKLVNQVLSRELLFSKLIRQIGAVMPDNSVLLNLSILKAQGGLDLKAAARDQNTATQIQVNLQDPNNKIFQSVDINNIDCKDDSSRVYPCVVTLRALFGPNNQFLFIQPTSSGATKK